MSATIDTATPTAPTAEVIAEAKAARWTPLTTEQAKALVRNARPAIAPCLCGCGNTTKGRFFPGHDATLKQTLAATVASGTPAAKTAAQDALVGFGWA